MAEGIDRRTGQELGLDGQYAGRPAFQIVNDAHHSFLLLTGRLINLEYGSFGEVFKRDPAWPQINVERRAIAEKLLTLGGNALDAADLSKKIRHLNEVIDKIAAE
ncbi:hypothetical protein [Rhizobium sp. NFACC06-2]|uniref:hypothetical protein n=1 Tax=Rhizobium sp. NFACC06-2 TaxID=1566264 RepID=UPI0008772A93|nr:hypothetical protein [Rhizobium sp. NFACC06-2]SCY90351.1 hypothetical protein SAMN03159288_05092 [Rhizobium sp. NFACC06-2]